MGQRSQNYSIRLELSYSFDIAKRKNKNKLQQAGLGGESYFNDHLADYHFLANRNLITVHI